MSASQQKARPVLRVELIEDDGDWSDLGDVEGVIERAASATAQALGRRASQPGLVSVALSSDAQVAALNERYRGKAKPTNVLSFPAGAGAAAGHLGDIVIARETVEREAHEQGVPVRSPCATSGCSWHTASFRL